MRFICSLLLFVSFLGFSMGSNARFERLSIEQGLSQSTINYMVQDHKGFIWIATQDGLNRWDGYQFKVFRHDPDDNGSISDNYVNTLLIDNQGTLWTGGHGGVNRYDSETERFTRFQHDPSNPASLSSDQILSLAQDKLGRIWVGTYGVGLNLLDSSATRFQRFRRHEGDASGLSHDKVWALLADSKGNLWIGTSGGLDKLPVEELEAITAADATLNLVHYRHDANDPNSISHNSARIFAEDANGKIWVGTYRGVNRLDSDLPGQKPRFTRLNSELGIVGKSVPNQLSQLYIRSLSVDRTGVVWIGTIGGGLIRYNGETQRIEHLSYIETDPHSVSSNEISSIIQDHQGTLWVGSWGDGLNKLNHQYKQFGHFKPLATDSNSLSHSDVNVMLKTTANDLWIGTHNGLNHFDETTHQFTHFKHSPEDPLSISGSDVTALYQDEDGILWIGTDREGINRFDIKRRQFVVDQRLSAMLEFSDNHISSIVADKHGDIWFGSQNSGLLRLNPKTNTAKLYFADANDPNSLSDDQIVVIYSDNDGDLWIGTAGNGLNKFNFATDDFTVYRHQPDNRNSLSNDAVYAINQDEFGVIWLGTKVGLNRFDKQTETFRHYRRKHGLPNDYVLAIAIDDDNQVWMSTHKGLSHFDPVTEQFKNYDRNDGLQSDEFSFNTYFESADGELFFGGVNGFNRFYPSQIVEDTMPPTVVLTDLLVANKSVVLPKVIDHLSQLVLDHRQNLVTFEFAGLHFAQPKENQYAYRLVGQDEDWIYTDANNRRATYTNLSDGDYTLMVKASNHHGYWTEQPKVLSVRVLPPPWKTWWAYIIYCFSVFLLVVVMLSAFVKSQRQRLEAQRQKWHDQQLLNQQLTEVDQLKDEFLANTSHELRTPLNGIIGLAESLMDGVAGALPAAANHNLAMVVASGRRLSNLVNDILDFSKLKNHNLTLVTKPLDLHSVAELVLALSRPLVGDKPLRLVNDIYPDLPSVEADENRLMQIMHNLVGNAIKYTDSGTITLSASLPSRMDDKNIYIKVSDTGVGIEAKYFDSIFKSFEQLEDEDNRHKSGTGLGLAITKQLVEFHGGTIEVESMVGQGSVFTFTLPRSTQPGVKLDDNNCDKQQSISRLYNIEQHESGHMELPTVDGKIQGAKILLVDDEPINRQVLHNLLALQNFQLVEATGGEQALQMIERDGPFDLVLLDIMMPKLSGFEVCQRLRQQYAVSDLPVIFLTAKNQVGDLVQSFAMGGNDYLTKPVTKHELLARVELHLRLREINKTLEQKVVERTADLEQKHALVLKTEKELAQKEHQRKLAQSETLASLGTLTAGIGHEIKNPVNFIGLGASALANDLQQFQAWLIKLAGDDAEQAVIDSFTQQMAPLFEQIETINEGAQRVKVIVEDLRSFTQQDSQTKHSVEIGKKLQATLNLVKPNYIETIDFISEFDAQLKLECYPSQLNQVFMNLIVNACDAIAERRGEMPGLESYGKPMSKARGIVEVGCKRLDDKVEIYVKDNGNGMSDETQNRLFEPFYTTKGESKGTGLGLSISYGIMQKHGGEISVESTLGVGTSVVMTIPTNDGN